MSEVEPPHHVAIIMDGNRRWAQRHFLPPVAGHWKGASNLKSIVRSAKESGIHFLTVYAFSTENWRRTESEKRALFDLFRLYLLKERADMVAEGVRLEAIGDLEKLPCNLQKSLRATIEATAHCDKITLILALNYGGRDEICRAVGAIAADVREKKLLSDRIDESLFRSYLDTANWPDPDLVIRTSGELRLSNFLLWQISYTEIYTTEVLWPEFSPDDLSKAIQAYCDRKRRNGV